MFRTFPDVWRPEKLAKRIERQLREAIEFHLDGMREDGMAIPKPTSICQYIDSSR